MWGKFDQTSLKAQRGYFRRGSVKEAGIRQRILKVLLRINHLRRFSSPISRRIPSCCSFSSTVNHHLGAPHELQFPNIAPSQAVHCCLVLGASTCKRLCSWAIGHENTRTTRTVLHPRIGKYVYVFARLSRSQLCMRRSALNPPRLRRSEAVS